MATKKKTKKKSPSARSAEVTPVDYVEARVRELAPEHGWDVKHVVEVVRGEKKPPSKKS